MKKLSLFAMILLAALLLSSCSAERKIAEAKEKLPSAFTTETSSPALPETTVTAEPTAVIAEPTEPEPLGVVLTLGDLEGEQPLLSKKQEAFMAENDYNSITKYCNAEDENSRPRYVKLTWKADSDSKPEGLTYTVRVSESEDMADAREFFLEDKKSPSVLVYNLMPRTVYYWNVTAEADGKTAVSETKSFVMADSLPRVIHIDGVTNCRDLGGWALADGGRIKYGMVYRTATLNNNKTTEPRITADGIDTMLNVLGVKTEIDLRGHLYDDGIMENGITESVLGDGVRYCFCPLEYGHDLKTDTDEIRRVFGIFADESNYPVFFHCAIGTDRTGMIATVLEALLGVSEHDIYMDYVFSNFGKIASRDSMRLVNESDSYLTQIRQFEGTTDSESARNYLISIGVTEDEIGEIIRILTE